MLPFATHKTRVRALWKNNSATLFWKASKVLLRDHNESFNLLQRYNNFYLVSLVTACKNSSTPLSIFLHQLTRFLSHLSTIRSFTFAMFIYVSHEYFSRIIALESKAGKIIMIFLYMFTFCLQYTWKVECISLLFYHRRMSESGWNDNVM